MAELKRKVARAVAVLSIALGAGHLVQTVSKREAPRVAMADIARPVDVVPLAASAETVPALPAAASQPALPDTALAPAPLPVPPADVAPPTQLAEVPAAAPAADPCPVSLELLNDTNAMIGLTLLAPCHTGERVVLRHAGLAVTAFTTLTGALFTSLPALEKNAAVEVKFADGTATTASIEIPEIGQIRRFGIQWQADDAFQLHAFEDGSGYDGPGHISAESPHAPAPGLLAKGGFLTLLGDQTTDLPLLAAVYTFPADAAAKPDVVVEAAVTEKTCGREMLGETLTSTGGTVFVNDLTVAMPSCDAIGDYLVLKNLVPDLNIAAAN